MKTLTILIPLGLVGATLLGTAFGAAPAPNGGQEVPAVAVNRAIATIPIVVMSAQETTRQAPPPTAVPPATATPRPQAPVPRSLPTRVPAPAPEPAAESLAQLPTKAEREGCDPAYPEQRTCIPPGPPFDQGCAITAERRFRVLPPDPQRLDHDNDGIGCEPMGTT